MSAALSSALYYIRTSAFYPPFSIQPPHTYNIQTTNDNNQKDKHEGLYHIITIIIIDNLFHDEDGVKPFSH